MIANFPKAYRLLKRKEFVLVYETGTPYRNAGFHLFVLKRNDEGPTRIGLTVTKGAGKSVVRNRIRRRSREIFRHLHDNLQPGYDLVLNHHPRLADMPREEFDRLFRHVLERAHLL